MRKITQCAIDAFIEQHNFNSGNTKVVRINDGTNIKTELLLHNELIAYEINGNTYISSQGWETSTTRERLNGLLSELDGGRVYIRDFNMFYEDSQKITSPLQDKYFKEVR